MPRSFVYKKLFFNLFLQEELLIVIDIGKSMKNGSGMSRLEYSKAAISMLIQGKVLLN